MWSSFLIPILKTVSTTVWLSSSLVDINVFRREINLFSIDFEKYILFNAYKFCNKTLKLKKLFLNTIDLKCRVECLFSNCNTIYFQSMIKTFNAINRTKFKLILTDFPHLRSIEIFKLDMNGLIYNLGGVIGLWFGLSPVSIVYLVKSTCARI
jgi:hypothetical protein